MTEQRTSQDDIEQRFDDLVLESLASLRDAIRSADGTKEALAIARLALGAMGGWTRFQATKRARDATAFQLARALAQNPEEMREYIRQTMPNVHLVQYGPKALDKGPAN